MLEEVVAQVVQVPAKVPVELLNRFSNVYLIDCSLVNLPSKKLLTDGAVKKQSQTTSLNTS